jgi:serine/threonine protein kinase
MADEASRIGLQVGNYRLVHLLGKGGFAEVYLGEHIHLHTQVAVKLLHTQLADEDIESFKREAQTLAHLLHPHIIRVLDFGLAGNTPYLMMDYAPNGTLRQRHKRGEPLPLATVVQYIRQVAEALQYAHDQRLVHRDIKPENMLIGRNQEILLSDFGIALIAQSSQYQSPQDIAGTIAYMAPEQIQAHPRPASDQYSLGVVAYEWLSGQRPFQGSFTEIAAKHSMVSPPPLRERLPLLPQAVEQVIMTALQKDPHQRFATVRAFALALEQTAQQSQTTFVRPSSYAITPTAETVMTPSGNLPDQATMTPQQRPDALPYNPAGTLIEPPSPQYQQAKPYPPHEVMPPVNFPGQEAPRSKTARGISRRAFVLGTAGVATVAGAATWFVLSQKSAQPTQPKASSSSSKPVNHATSTAQALLFTYRGQINYIWSIAWSPNGQSIASSAHGGNVQVWNPSNGQQILVYHRNKANNWAPKVVWSPDSTQIAVNFLDGILQTVQIATNKPVHTYTVAGTTFVTVDWSRDGKYLAAAGANNNIYVLDVTSGKVMTTCTGHTARVNAVAWAHGGKRFASCSQDSTVKVWETSTGKLLRNYTGHHKQVYSISWSHADTYIASASADGTAQVWYSSTGIAQTVYKGLPGGLVYSAAWSNNRSDIASSGNGSETHVWNAHTGKLINKYLSGPAYSLAWSPDDTRMVTADFDRTAKIWKVH